MEARVTWFRRVIFQTGTCLMNARDSHAELLRTARQQKLLSAQHHNRTLQNGLLIIPVSPKFSNKYWSWNFIPHKAFWRYSRLAVSERYGRRKFFERRADGASSTAKNVTVSALQSAPIFYLHQTHHFELITKAAK